VADKEVLRDIPDEVFRHVVESYDVGLVRARVGEVIDQYVDHLAIDAREIANRIVREFRPGGWPAKEEEIARAIALSFRPVEKTDLRGPMRARLDRRIHAQRKELAFLWSIIEGRQRSWRSHTLAMMLEFGKFLDELGVERGGLTLYGRMQEFRKRWPAR
jgi:hypothetical protein